MIRFENICGSASILSVTNIVTLALILFCLNHVSVLAQTTERKPTKTEQEIEAQIKAGKGADAEKQHISAGFLIDLIKKYGSANQQASEMIYIQNAEIDGNVELNAETISSRVSLENCIFDGDVDFSASEFQKDLSLKGSTFKGTANFYKMRVAGDLRLEKAIFTSEDRQINLDSVNISGTFHFYDSDLEGSFTLEGAVLNELECSRTNFKNRLKEFRDRDGTMHPLEANADFYNMQINGNASFTGSTFEGFANFDSADIGRTLELSAVEFRSSYSLSDTKYRRLNNAPLGALSLIEKSKYSHSAFTYLEASYRGEGLQRAADEVYIAGMYKEGGESGQLEFVWNRLLYWTVGYGKHLERALAISLFFFIPLGFVVFFKESNMLIQPEDKANFQGKYNPLWYSIALFLPIVNLEDTKIWTPNPTCKCRRKWLRQWRRHYMRVHIIVGYLLIPLGLAAWTGLIK